ncbi:MAG: hypothetical protein WC757_03595 [Candidatus Paceibacterota bacterium]|jgi:hypothetical protein
MSAAVVSSIVDGPMTPVTLRLLNAASKVTKQFELEDAAKDWRRNVAISLVATVLLFVWYYSKVPNPFHFWISMTSLILTGILGLVTLRVASKLETATKETSSAQMKCGCLSDLYSAHRLGHEENFQDLNPATLKSWAGKYLRDLANGIMALQKASQEDTESWRALRKEFGNVHATLFAFSLCEENWKVYFGPDTDVRLST